MSRVGAASGSAVSGLQLEHQIVYESVEAINMETATPASPADVCAVLDEAEQEMFATSYKSPLKAAVGKILRSLGRRGLLSSVRSGRSRLYFVQGALPPGACDGLEKPSRRRRVLALVQRAVELRGRALLAGEVVEAAEEEGLTAEIPAEMIKRDLMNLARTGELRVTDVVRSAGSGSNLYLPAELDPARYAVDEPITWLEEVRDAFDSVWQSRVAAASELNRKPVPPSTGDVRAFLRARRPDHPRLENAQLLVNAMKQLSRGGSPHVRAVRRKGRRRLLWAPVGVVDEALDLGAAHAGDSERVADAVTRAMASLNLPAITLRDAQDEMDRDAALRPAGQQDVYQILSDAAREELVNADGTRSRRVRQHVVRAGVVGGRTYYTVPGAEGVEEYLGLLRLRSEWPELKARERIDQLSSCRLSSVRVGRAQLITLECNEIAARGDVLATRLDHDGWAKEVEDIAARAAERSAEATAAMEAHGPPQLPERPARPPMGFVPEEMLAVIGPRYPLVDEDMTRARLVSLMEKHIRRIPNPRFERRFNTDSETAAEFLFERVEALGYIAFRWGDEDERYYANLGLTTLGRLRDAHYVSPALHSDRFEDRLAAVACLALLGDPDAELPAVAREDEEGAVRGAAVWGMNFTRSIEEAIS